MCVCIFNIRSDKKRMTSILRNEMGFQMRYIERAFTVYEDNYGNDYDVCIFICF